MILSIISQKGGVGKTTTAAMLAAGLAIKKKKVLLVDLDGQCNLSLTTGAIPTDKTILDVLDSRKTAQEAITESGPYKTIAGHSNMVLWRPDKPDIIKRILKPLASQFDFIILDTPPQLGEIVINALTASDAAIITLQADLYGLQSLAQLKETIDAIKTTANPGLKILGLLLTRHNGRTVLGQTYSGHIAAAAVQLETAPFKATIRESVIIREAVSQQQSIFDYSPKAPQTQDFRELVNEILKRIK